MLEYAAMQPRPARLMLVLVALASLSGWIPAAAQDAEDSPPGLSCRAFLLYDAEHDRIVAAHNAERRQPIASLTKLMTAILACERLRFDGRYVLKGDERKTFDTDSLRVDKLLELMLVPSNNAACKTVARLVAGNEQAFALEMNAKAAQLGLQDTHYVNATGLPADGQYSTARDLLTVARVALTYPQVQRIIGLRETSLGQQDYESTLLPLYTRHAGLRGGKTGFTKAAGRCLVLYYRSAGRDYLLITLGSSGVAASFRDAELLLAYYGLYQGEVGEWAD